MACQHGTSLRGSLVPRPTQEGGRFGYLFRGLPAAKFGSNDEENKANLTTLATAMTSTFDPPSDRPDGEESGIPALYTYLGQFIDHDLTFDPASVLVKQQDPDGIENFRSPALDLDNVYGRGPQDQPYMYDGAKFRLGDKLSGENVPDANDLPRFAGRALIGDPRNDENAIVSQLQGLFHRFHNRMVDDHPELSFEQVQERVRFHYHYVVLNDFLARIVSGTVLDCLKNKAGKFDRGLIKCYHWDRTPFIPVEFSVASYRLGHSMIRPGYRLNDDDKTLLPIFPVASEGLSIGLTGFRPLSSGQAIDWGRFIDTEKRAYGDENTPTAAANKRRLQFAYHMDTSLVDPLSDLPLSVASDAPSSLPLRNLERAWRLGLPSGQSVAKAIGVHTLEDSEILIGKVADLKSPTDAPKSIDQIAGGVFRNNCPLWTYILAEAIQHRLPMPIPTTDGPAAVVTPQLGPVGGRIVAEVIVGLLFADTSSMLSKNPSFQPVTGAGFRLKDFVTYALGLGPAL